MSKPFPTPTAAALPAPAPLPSLQTAFSRRAAIFGAVTGGAALMAGNYAVAVALTAPPVLDPADGRLVELAKAYAALDQSDATHVAKTYGPLEETLASTPTATLVGVVAKAWALQVQATRMEPGIGASLADDILRIHAAHRLF